MVIFGLCWLKNYDARSGQRIFIELMPTKLFPFWLSFILNFCFWNLLQFFFRTRFAWQSFMGFLLYPNECCVLCVCVYLAIVREHGLVSRKHLICVDCWVSRQLFSSSSSSWIRHFYFIISIYFLPLLFQFARRVRRVRRSCQWLMPQLSLLNAWNSLFETHEMRAK